MPIFVGRGAPIFSLLANPGAIVPEQQALLDEAQAEIDDEPHDRDRDDAGEAGGDVKAFLAALDEGADAVGREQHLRGDGHEQRGGDAEAQATAMAQRVSANTDAYVRENPWTVAGGALATGLILGAAFIACLRSGAGDRAVS